MWDQVKHITGISVSCVYAKPSWLTLTCYLSFFQTGMYLIKSLLLIFSGIFMMSSAQVLRHFKLLYYCKINEWVESGVSVALETNLLWRLFQGSGGSGTVFFFEQLWEQKRFQELRKRARWLACTLSFWPVFSIINYFCLQASDAQVFWGIPYHHRTSILYNCVTDGIMIDSGSSSNIEQRKLSWVRFMWDHELKACYKKIIKTQIWSGMLKWRGAIYRQCEWMLWQWTHLIFCTECLC